MCSAAAAANRSLGIDRGLPFPLDRPRPAPTRCCCSAATSPRRCRPSVAHLAGAAARGGLVVVDPRRSATAELADDGQGVHLQPVPGHRPGRPARPRCTSCSPRAWSTRPTSRSAPRASTRCAAASAAWWPERAEQVRGVPAAAAARRPPGCSPRPARPRGGRGAYVLTGRGVEQHAGHRHRHRRDQPRARPRAARPGRQRVRRDHRAGQRPGRPRARPEVRPAARLPDDRRPGRARARRRGLGRRPATSLPGKGDAGRRAARTRSARPAVRAPCSCTAPTSLVSAPNAGRGRRAARRARPARRLRLRAVRDGAARRRRPPGHPVGRGGGHDDLARGPGHPAPPGGRAPRRRPQRAVGLVRAGPRGSGRPGTWSTDPAEVFDELRPRQCRWPRRLQRAEPRPARRRGGALLAVPRPGDGRPAHPGTPRLFLDRFPTPDGRARLVAVDHRRTQRRPPRRRTALPRHRAGCCSTTSPARRPGGSRRSPRPCPEPFVEVHPLLAARLGVDRRRAACGSPRPRVGRPRRPASPTGVRPDTVFMPFHWGGAGSVNRLTNDATDPVSGMPEFKVCAVDVAAATTPARSAAPPDRPPRVPHRGGRMTRLVVVGNGMVGARFVEDLLARGPRRPVRRHRARRRGVRAVQPGAAQRGRRRRATTWRR